MTTELRGQEQRNGAVLDRLNEEVLRQRSVDTVDELLADDFIEHDPPPGMASDREGFKDFIRAVHQAFADQLHTVHDQVVADAKGARDERP